MYGAKSATGMFFAMQPQSEVILECVQLKITLDQHSSYFCTGGGHTVLLERNKGEE